MDPLDTVAVTCPYCGERIELLVDASVDASVDVQQYVEDCPVCCRPMVVSVAVNGRGGIALTARREDE
jgi:hypothetical protein